MIRTQISLDEKMYAAAKKEAARQGISMAELVRRALAVALLPGLQDDRPWMRFAGSLASGDPNASLTMDDIVYGRERP